MSKNIIGLNYGPIPVRPYTIKELGLIYGFSPKVMRQALRPFAKEIGPKLGWHYQIPQVEIIFSKLSVPHYLRVKTEDDLS